MNDFNKNIYQAAQRGSINAANRGNRNFRKPSTPKQIADLRTFLAACVAQVREDRRFYTKGEAEKEGGAREATSVLAVSRIRVGMEPTDRDFEGADKVIAFVSTLNTSNEFNAKMVSAVFEARTAGVIPFTAGVIAYTVASFMKSVKRNAERAVVAASEVKVDVDASRITNLFEKARAAGLKFPKVTFGQGDKTIQFSFAGPRSKYAGSIMVTDGRKYPDNTWYGRIEGGSFIPTQKCSAEVSQLITDFAEDPAKVAGAAGRVTGNCVFCRLELSDKLGRSQAVGYGKRCSEKWGLPWGQTRIEADVVIAAESESKVTYKEI